MFSIFSKIWKKRYFFHTLYFNFHYLPFKQAIKLPIYVYKPTFSNLKGKIRINGPIKSGMIRLGFQLAGIIPDNGIILEINGGEIIFNGPCEIGSCGAVSVGENGRLEFGTDIFINGNSRIVCFHHIILEKDVHFGWDSTVMDTDFHFLIKPDGTHTKGYGKIHIGEGCWCGSGCRIMKRTVLPPHTIVQGGTLLDRRYDIPEMCIIGPNTEVTIKTQGLYCDFKNCTVTCPPHQD